MAKGSAGSSSSNAGLANKDGNETVMYARRPHALIVKYGCEAIVFRFAYLSALVMMAASGVAFIVVSSETELSIFSPADAALFVTRDKSNNNQIIWASVLMGAYMYRRGGCAYPPLMGLRSTPDLRDVVCMQVWPF